MKQLNILHLCLLVYLCATPTSELHADTAQEIAEKAHLASINALLIFTSQDGLSAGRYNFTEGGFDMDVYSLPFTYHFESKKSPVNYFLVGNVGYSRVFLSKDIEPPAGGRLDYDNHIRTYTAGIGGGVRYRATQDIHFLGSAEVIYSKSGASVKQPDDDLGNAIEDFFDQDYNDNLSYALFAGAEYAPVINEFKPYAKLSYKLYETKSEFSFDELVTFSTESSVTTLALGIESPSLLKYAKNYLTLEGYAHANYLTGAIEKAVEFDLYRTLGAVAYWYTPGGPSWAGRFFLKASKVHSNGLNGYNIGVGFTAKF